MTNPGLVIGEDLNFSGHNEAVTRSRFIAKMRTFPRKIWKKKNRFLTGWTTVKHLLLASPKNPQTAAIHSENCGYNIDKHKEEKTHFTNS